MRETIGFDHEATVKNWNNKVFEEHLRGAILEPLYGVGESAVIQILPEVETGEGDQFIFSFAPDLDASKGITGATKLKGTEDDLTFFTDKVTIQEYGHAVSVRFNDISQKRTNIDLAMRQKRSLERWLVKRGHMDIMKALLDTTSGRKKTRYIYGNSDNNWNNDHKAAKATLTAQNDKLTCQTLVRAKHKAMLEGAAKMRPANVSTKDGFPVEQFIFLSHSLAIADLMSDPEWRAREYHDNIVAKGRMDGAFYKGSYDGVAVYEVPEVQMIELGAGANKETICHSLLLGAQAACIGYGMQPEFRFDNDDYGRMKNLGVLGIKGEKKTVFNGEDFATVHIFSTLN